MGAPTVLYDTSALGDARRDAGIGRYVSQLLAALRLRTDVVVRAPRPGAPPRSESRPFRWLRVQPALFRAARGENCDVFHATGGDPALTVSAARQVVTLMDAEMWRMPVPAGPRGIALRVHRRAVAVRLSRCAAVITASAVSAAEVCETLGLDPQRVHVVPLGVTAVFTAQAADGDRSALAAAGVSPAGYLMWAGSLLHHDPRKALDTLLDAVEGLGSAALPLVLAGARGDEGARLEAAARRRKVDVRVVGRREDSALAALYRSASVCVVPSLHEGFGLPLLEAMACGAPVVTSDGGNLPALGGGATVIAPAGDSAALTAAIAALLRDPQRREQLSRAGIGRAARFTWDRCAAETAAVYRLVAAQQWEASSRR